MKKNNTPAARILRKGRSSRSAYKGCAVRRDLRLAIYLRDAFRCLYCIRDLRGADPQDVTLDHLRPSSKGGSSDSKNLVTACRSCNCSRGDLPVARFASPEAQAHIKRNRARSIRCNRVLAKAIISGEISDPRKA